MLAIFNRTPSTRKDFVVVEEVNGFDISVSFQTRSTVAHGELCIWGNETGSNCTAACFPEAVENGFVEATLANLTRAYAWASSKS